MQKQAMENKLLYKMYKKEFEEIFKIPLKRFLNLEDMMHLICGFDIVSFDREINVPDGQSTKQFIWANYGFEAVKMIEKLIGND